MDFLNVLFENVVFAFHFEFRTGAWAWFHDVWTCSAEVLEY
jgi:hypothetical protein